MEGYKKEISLAIEKAKELKDKKKSEELLSTISENTAKHQEVLEGVLEKVPSKAKEAILKAIEVNKKWQEKTQEQASVPKKQVDKLKEEIDLLRQQKKDGQDTQIEEMRKEIEVLKSNNPSRLIQPQVIKISTPIAKLSNSKIINKVKPAVVYIQTVDGSGSGMIIENDGYILTNAHVVKGVTNVEISLLTGETLPGTVVGRDEAVDLAIVKVSYPQKLPKIEFGDSNRTNQGDDVFTFGFPFGIEGDVSFKEGTISRRIGGYLETSAEIHPGNSGGPLVNVRGKVIGINTAILGKSVDGVQLGETIKFAIPINVAVELIPELKAGRNIIVESREEKQAKQESANMSACLAESSRYYKKLVSSIEQIYGGNSPGLESIISQIDKGVDDVKQSLNEQISRATNIYDNRISELRRVAEKYIKSIQTSAGRSGRPVSEDKIASVNEKLDSDVDYQESQKQLLISSARLSADTQIQKYEAMKVEAQSKREKRKQTALENARTDKVEYYNKCMNR